MLCVGSFLRKGGPDNQPQPTEYRSEAPTSAKRMKTLVMLKTAAVLLLMAALMVVAWAWRSWSPRGSMVSGNGYTGLIRSYGDSRWTPPKQTITVLEADLKAFLSSDESLRGSRLASEPDRFWREYGGYEKAGSRFVHIAFLHNDHISRRTFLNGVMVDGGGDFYWVAHYDVEKRTFTRISHNGPM